MKKLLLCMLVLLSLCLGSCKKASNEEEDNRPTFTVGMECAYAPFNWVESRKTATNYPIDGTRDYAEGYDVQIAKKIADGLDRKLVIKAIDWAGLTAALDNGSIDAVIAGMSPTEDRKLSVDFTNAYYTSTHVLLMLKTSKYVTGETLSDFSGANVVGQMETLYDSLIDQLVGVNHSTPLEDVPTIISSLTSQRNDITILEEPVAKGIVESNSKFTYVKLTDGFNVSEADVCVSIAIKKGQAEFLSSINQILATISENERAEIMEQAILNNSK